MNITSAESNAAIEPAACRAWTKGRTVFVELQDGRNIEFSADRFQILSKSSDEQLKKVTLEV